jgi:hypothetical protein
MNEGAISMRLPQELLERADALIPAIEADPELGSFGRASRAAVLRLALVRGLQQLEEQFGRRKGKGSR